MIDFSQCIQQNATHFLYECHDYRTETYSFKCDVHTRRKAAISNLQKLMEINLLFRLIFVLSQKTKHAELNQCCPANWVWSKSDDSDVVHNLFSEKWHLDYH